MRSRHFKHAGPSCHARIPSRAAHVVRASVFGIDWILRRWYGVRPYSSSDGALLRIALSQAATGLVLADGTHVMAGDLIIDLHIWNERVPALGLPGRSLFWACRVRNRIRLSLSELAWYLELEPDLHRYVAVRAEAFLITERAARNLARVAAHFGLMQAGPQRPADWGHGMLVWLLAWACNPRSVSGKQSRPLRHEFWMSAAELRTRYLAEPPEIGLLLNRYERCPAAERLVAAPGCSISRRSCNTVTMGAFNDQRAN